MVFEVFRRRQKQMIAVLAVLAMFAFVLAGMLDRLSRTTGRSSDPAVAKAWGREILRSEVAGMQSSRYLANQFVSRSRMWVGLQVYGPWRDQSEEGVIQAIVLLEKAQRLGLTVFDSEVTDFINQVTENKLSKDDFNQLLFGGTSIDDPTRQSLEIGEHELYDVLRREILIEKVINALTTPVTLDTPLELWEKNAPTLTHVRLELARVPISKFVDGSEKPTDEQLRQIYDKYKDQAGDPDEGIIGFRKPRQLDVQYLVANVDDHLKGITVTEKEAREYYNEHKDDFKVEDVGEVDVPAPPKTAPKTAQKSDKEPAAKKSSPAVAKPSASQPKTPASPARKAAAKPKQQSQDAVKPKPAAKAAPKAKADPKPGPEAQSKALPKAKADAKAPAATTQPKKPAKAAPAKADGSAFVPGLRPLVNALCATGTSALAAEKDAEDSKGKEAKPQEPQAQKKAVEKPANKPEEAKTAEKAPAKAKKKEEKPAEEIKPFEKVKPEIELILKREKAGEKIVETMRSILQKTMYPYADKYDKSLREHRQSGDQKDFTPPSPPDLAKIAKEDGFTLKSTGLLTPEAFADSEGVSSAVRVGEASPRYAEETVVSMIDRQKVFRGRVVRSDDSKTFYLYWKTVDQEPQSPTFEEVRAEVERVWRLQQAGPKAEAKAKELAEAIRKAQGDFDKGLKGTGYEAIVTERPFPRATRQFQSNPFMTQPPLVSATIPEVPRAGEEFLDAVFKMEVGEVTVLPDSQKDNYYVVKVKDRVDPDFAQFVDNFTVETRMRELPGGFGQRAELIQRRGHTVDEICQEAKLVMVKPDRPSDAEAPEPTEDEQSDES